MNIDFILREIWYTNAFEMTMESRCLEYLIELKKDQLNIKRICVCKLKRVNLNRITKKAALPSNFKEGVNPPHGGGGDFL